MRYVLDDPLPGCVACTRCGASTPLYAAHRAHTRWIGRVPWRVWYAGPGPTARGRWWGDDAPAWLCASCALLARPAPVEPPHGPTPYERATAPCVPLRFPLVFGLFSSPVHIGHLH